MEKKKSKPEKWVSGRCWMDELGVEVHVASYTVKGVVEEGEEWLWEDEPSAHTEKVLSKYWVKLEERK